MDYGKIACYLRVSDRKTQKTDSQIPTVERWLKNHGYARDSVLWIVDKESAAHLDRPGFQRLEEAIFMGEVDTVVVYHANRLSRTYIEGVQMLDRWWKKGVRVVSISQQIDMDSAMGQAMNGLHFAWAQTEREDLLKRQREGIELAKKRGVYQGRKPGSLKGRKSGGEDKVKKVAELHNKGVRISDIVKAVNLSRRTVYNYIDIGRSEGLIQ